MAENGQRGQVPGERDGHDDATALAEIRAMLTAAGAPDEMLAALDDPDQAAELLEQLTGELPHESVEGLLAFWEPLLARGVSQLDAELTGAKFLSLTRATIPDPETRQVFFQETNAAAEQQGGPAALAMLRVLAVIGPEELRFDAAAAADRLAASGVKDRPWVKGLGAPAVDACFGYTDDLGAQEAVALAFRYGRKRHAVCVLIDHDLGGGVKDCWVTDQVDAIRAGYRAHAASAGMLTYHDYTPAGAQAIVTAALTKEPCPEQPDQIEDVADHLDLLRQRTELLAQEEAPAGATVHRIKVTLRGTKPPIWRRLEVPSTITLDKLHRAIQESFGWQDYHMWMFETPRGSYGISDPELGIRRATAIKLSQVAPASGDRLRYTYDFGDDWEHDVQVEEVGPAEAGTAYPRCLAGRRAGPPEDCGGVWGYTELLEILADPRHPEHEERLEWLGLESADDLDPARFDPAQVNQALTSRVLSRGVS